MTTHHGTFEDLTFEDLTFEDLTFEDLTLIFLILWLNLTADLSQKVSPSTIYYNKQ